MAELTRPSSRSNQYLQSMRQRTSTARQIDLQRLNLEQWKQTREKLRGDLLRAWGGFPQATGAPRVQTLEIVQRDAYHIEKLLIETYPDVWMTALAYVPRVTTPVPAVLNVHGHWSGAKQDPTVQARCQGLARLGFFVLVVDAFGAGDRAVGTPLGEYHGEMTAATLIPSGHHLSGIQVFENMRAVDYLHSRPEVQKENIGVTGASGGGNQSMYVGAYDDRLKCVVPVCSVGSYQVYLGVACCMCEVVPGAHLWTEEAGILALTAPRALMIINATRDAVQFSVPEAQATVQQTRHVFDLYRSGTHLKHALFESPHDYNQAMREAMYGWMTLHLKQQGDGSPISEPKLTFEDRESLRCFPQGSRPATFMTLPQFAAKQGSKFVSAIERPQDAAAAQEWCTKRRQRLAEQVLGKFPDVVPAQWRIERHPTSASSRLWFQTEPGVEVFADIQRGHNTAPWAIITHLDTSSATATHPLTLELQKRRWNLAILNPRGIAELAPARNSIAHAIDHNSAQWGLWTGRPQVGQWAWDTLQLARLLPEVFGSRPANTLLCGMEQGALTSLLAGIYVESKPQVLLWNPLVSYVTNVPFRKQLLGSMLPEVLRDVGDIPHLIAMIPSHVTIAGGLTGGGDSATPEEAQRQFALSRDLRHLITPDLQTHILPAASATDVVNSLRI